MVISGVNAIAASVYVYMQYFQLSPFIIILGSFCWLCAHGQFNRIYYLIYHQIPCIFKDCPRPFICWWIKQSGRIANECYWEFWVKIIILPIQFIHRPICQSSKCQRELWPQQNKRRRRKRHQEKHRINLSDKIFNEIEEMHVFYSIWLNLKNYYFIFTSL